MTDTRENPEEVQALIKEVEKKAARQGVDIIGLSERAYQGRNAKFIIY
jgi:hypothetical protein